MFRRIIGLILILLVLTANFSRLFIYAGFELNKDYIVAELCENRNIPTLNCDGQCYLAKKIKQASENEGTQKESTQKQHFQEASLSQPLIFKSQNALLNIFAILPFLITLTRFPSIIFHPPKV